MPKALSSDELRHPLSRLLGPELQTCAGRANRLMWGFPNLRQICLQTARFRNHSDVW